MQDCFARTFPEFRDEVQIFMAGEFPRELFRHFQANGILGTGLTYPASAQGARTATVQPFGQPQEWLTGTVNIARAGATIIPGFFLFLSRGFTSATFFIRRSVNPKPARDQPQTVQQVMDAYAAGI